MVDIAKVSMNVTGVNTLCQENRSRTFWKTTKGGGGGRTAKKEGSR